jgi:outer membrane protein assembly factor BamB
MLNDNGVLSCFEAETGKKCYQTRVGSRGNHSASPVAADGKIYVLSEEGVCTVVKAGAEFQVIAVNQMEGLFRASIAVSNGRLFLRSQGTLYCIGAK